MTTFKGTRPKSVHKAIRVSPDKLAHPNEKPLNLIEAIMRDISVEGELVVDFFSGSGTVSLAAKKMDRAYIAFELMKEHYDKSVKRIELNTRQTSIF